MPVVVSLDKENGIIRVVLSGCMDMTDVKQSVEEALKYYHQGHTKALIDVTDQELCPSTMDTYDLAVTLVEKARNLKQALVVSAKTTPDTRFLETLVRNRGGMMKRFQSEEEALTWLYDDNATD